MAELLLADKAKEAKLPEPFDCGIVGNELPAQYSRNKVELHSDAFRVLTRVIKRGKQQVGFLNVYRRLVRQSA
jgi:hypothetical protein